MLQALFHIHRSFPWICRESIKSRTPLLANPLLFYNLLTMTAFITFFGELTQATTTGANILWTVLLALCIIYWLFVIIGALDIEALDFDIDIDTDVEVDLDVDADVDVDTADNPVAWIGFLKFLNLDAIPFMVFFSIFTLSGWTLSILTSHYISSDWMTALALIIPILFISLILAKYITAPLVPLFRGLNDEAKELDLTGETGIVIHGFDSDELSQAQIKLNNEDHLVNIRIAGESSKKKFEKGASVSMLRKIKEGDMISYEVISPEALN